MNINNFLDVDYGEVRITKIKKAEIVVRDKDIESINGCSTFASARVLISGSWGFASSSGYLNVLDLMDKAKKSARLSKGDVRINKSSGGCSLDYEKEVDIDMGKRVQDIKEGINSIEEKKDVNIKTIHASYTTYYIEKEYYNSLGDEFRGSEYVSYLKARIIAANNGKVQEGIEVKGQLTPNISGIPEVMKKAYTYASESLKGRKIKPGRYTAVLDNEITGVFCHEVVGHASEGDSAITNNSILKDKMGKGIAPEFVNIVDDPSENSFGKYKIDDEGVRGRRVEIIKNGILSGFLNSRETGKALNMPLNGHARASTGKDIPIVRMSNTFMLPGKDKKEDVMDITSGIYIVGVRGGSVSTYTGEFMFTGKIGYVIKNGEITDTLRDITITGNLIETLRNIEAISSEIRFNPGWCGKEGQYVRVSDGGPHMRVSNMRLA